MNASKDIPAAPMLAVLAAIVVIAAVAGWVLFIIVGI